MERSQEDCEGRLFPRDKGEPPLVVLAGMLKLTTSSLRSCGSAPRSLSYLRRDSSRLRSVPTFASITRANEHLRSSGSRSSIWSRSFSGYVHVASFLVRWS